MIDSFYKRNTVLIKTPICHVFFFISLNSIIQQLKCVMTETFLSFFIFLSIFGLEGKKGTGIRFLLSNGWEKTLPANEIKAGHICSVKKQLVLWIRIGHDYIDQNKYSRHLNSWANIFHLPFSSTRKQQLNWCITELSGKRPSYTKGWHNRPHWSRKSCRISFRKWLYNYEVRTLQYYKHSPFYWRMRT